MIALSIVKRKVNNLTLETKMNVKLLTAEQVRKKLIDRRLSYVAEKCGLTYMSLSRIRKNDGNPSLLTLEKLSEYFHKNK
jgi:transcriptional regulator with XRE-family HTH domain